MQTVINARDDIKNSYMDDLERQVTALTINITNIDSRIGKPISIIMKKTLAELSKKHSLAKHNFHNETKTIMTRIRAITDADKAIELTTQLKELVELLENARDMSQRDRIVLNHTLKYLRRIMSIL